MKTFTFQAWRIVQIAAVLASLTGVTLISVGKTLSYFQGAVPYIAVISTGLVVVLATEIYARDRARRKENVVIRGRDLVNRECRRYMESARNDITIIGGDLSWLPENFSLVKDVTDNRGVKVRILYRCSEATGVQNNVTLGKKAGAELACYDPSDDPKIRCLLVDVEESHATLLVFKKLSLPHATTSYDVTSRDGSPGNLSIFEYQAEVYNYLKHRALIISVSQLLNRMWTDYLQAKQQ